MQKRFIIPQKDMEGELVQPGLLSCQGCGAALAMKLALQALGKETCVVIPACCWGIIVGTYPYSCLDIPVVHAPFATAAIMASGIKAGLDRRGEKDVLVMAWAGDGGTFDIGLQSLSGAAERNEDILYVCYDNEAYMNTGIQRSSATPRGAWTTTTPKEAVKKEAKKDMEKIMLGHHIPYFATASIAYPDDLMRKFKKARKIRGTKFIHLLAPCPPGWRIDSSQSVKVARMATLAWVFPIYEVENGKYSLNIIPENKITVKEYALAQGRFKNMPDEMLETAIKEADKRRKELFSLAGNE